MQIRQVSNFVLELLSCARSRIPSEFRQNDRPHVPMARTDIGQSSCEIKGARLWNDKFHLVNHHLYIKKTFRTTTTKHFIETYQYICYILSHFVCVLCCCHYIILMCSMLYHKTLSKYLTHWYWTTHFEPVMCLTHLGTIKYPPSTQLPYSCIIVK